MSDLDEVAAATRADAATPGPWTRVTPHSGYLQCPKCEQAEYVAKSIRSVYGPAHHNDDADAEFIAHARTDLPAALAALAAVRAENADLRAALDRVTRLHQPMSMWATCPLGWRGCGESVCVETLDGGHVHNDQRDGTACTHCCDDDGEPVDYPCETVRAASVSPAPQPSHCPSCRRPLPHNDVERARCPDLMGPLKASIDAARACRVSPDPQEQR